MFDRRTAVTLAAGLLLSSSWDLRAQIQARARYVSFLTASNPVDMEAFIALLRVDLDKLGWTDDRIVLVSRTAQGKNDVLPSLAVELVSQRPDLILAQTVPATRALMQATKTIPIVMVSVATPVELGLVADYRKPGGNVTGSVYPADESVRKLLQFLKEAMPRLLSVAMFINPSNEAAAAVIKQMRTDTAALGMQTQVVEVLSIADFKAAFAAIDSAKTQSILVIPEPLIQSNRGAIAEFAQTRGLPVAFVGGRVLAAGGLFAFGPTRVEYAQITARFIDRILKGAKPGDLPIEQPTRFELAINLKSAKALGLTIPQALLLRADELIQ